MNKKPVLFGICLAVFPCLANADLGYSLRCLSGLDAISADISSSRTELSPKLARGLFGGLLRAVNEKGRPVSHEDIPPGRPTDARFCVGQEVDQAALAVLLKGYFGYLSDSPYDDFSQCLTGFMSLAMEIDQLHGLEAGFKFGLMAGRELGSQFVSLTYLYNATAPTLETLQDFSAKRLEKLSHVPRAEREQKIDSYLDMCDWYGVAIRSMYVGSRALKET